MSRASPHRTFRLITAALALSAASASVQLNAAALTPKPATGADARASAASSASVINRILDRLQPVSAELRQDAALWRAQFRAVLNRAAPETLQTIDAMQAKGGSANHTLVQAYQYAFNMAAADAGAQMAKELSARPGQKLASPTTDLVYVAISPCRVVDTRNVGGQIGFGAQRSFFFFSDSAGFSWSSQGGTAGNSGTACPATVFPTGTIGPAAAAATVTAVNTTAAGNFNVWEGGAVVPTISTLNWDHGGQIIANTTVIPAGPHAGSLKDFSVFYNGPSGQSDVVVDVVGYFIENVATALNCTTVVNPGTILTGTGSDTTIPYGACPSGYTQTGGYCNGGINTGTSGLYLIESGPVGCTYRNLGSNAPANAVTECCRVPGR